MSEGDKSYKEWMINMRRFLKMTTMSVAAWGVFVGGCSRQEHIDVNEAPPPAQAADQQPQGVVVQQAPPPLIVEVQPPAPSASVVWVGGYWNWDNQKYNWQAGHYSAPPQADVVWVAPRYDPDPHGVRYTPGQWSKKDH
jgi:hypothetical protein